MTRLVEYAAQARKALVAAAGVIGQLVALGVLHGQQLHYAQISVSVIAALLVHQVGNRAPVTAVEDLGGVAFDPTTEVADPNTAGASAPATP